MKRPVRLVFSDAVLAGAVDDVSRTGVRVAIAAESHDHAPGVLAGCLAAGGRLSLAIEGEKRREAELVWHGRSVGRHVVGLTFAEATGGFFASGRVRRKRPDLLRVRQRRRLPSGLAGSLRDLFLSIDREESSLEAVMRLLCERARALVDAEGVSFWALEDGRLFARADAGRWRVDLGSELPIGGDAPIPDFGVLKKAAQSGQQLFANDAMRSRFADHPGVERFGLKAVMIVPVFGPEVDFGLLVFGHSKNRYAFGERQQRDAEIFANQAALFLEKAEMVKRLRQESNLREALHRISLVFHQRLELDQVLEVICRESQALFGVDSVSVYLRESQGFVQRATAGSPLTGRTIVLDEIRTAGLGGEQDYFLNGVRALPETQREFLQRCSQGCVESVMVSWIRDRDELVGALVLGDWRDSARFTARDLETGRVLGEQAARAIANARLYEREVQSKRVLRQQDRFHILGEMAGVVAHQIKNALVPLRTLVDILPERYNDADFREWYETIVRREVDRMQALVEQLSRFRRRDEPHAEPIEPSALVRSVVDLLRPEAVSRRIAIEIEQEEALPPIVVVVHEIRHVLVSLVLNALQAVEQHGFVRVGARRDETGAVRLWVSDSGPGIPPDRLERIFDPLYTTKENGSGLGLAVARDLVGAHGGSLVVESTVGAGATFTVVLPASALSAPHPA